MNPLIVHLLLFFYHTQLFLSLAVRTEGSSLSPLRHFSRRAFIVCAYPAFQIAKEFHDEQQHNGARSSTETSRANSLGNDFHLRGDCKHPRPHSYANNAPASANDTHGFLHLPFDDR